MATAEALRFDGPGVFHPAEMVDVVDVEVAVATAAGPKEAVEAADLPHEFAAFTIPFGGEGGTDRAVHAVTAHEHDIAEGAILDEFVELLKVAAVTGHETDA